MIKINHIDITGYIETLPKQVIINKELCCEFLFCACAWVKSGRIQEHFSIPVLVSRKHAKCCLQKQKGTHLRIQGCLSFNTAERRYTGFYINAEKILYK